MQRPRIPTKVFILYYYSKSYYSYCLFVCFYLSCGVWSEVQLGWAQFLQRPAKRLTMARRLLPVCSRHKRSSSFPCFRVLICALAYAGGPLPGVIQSVLLDKLHEIPMFPGSQQICCLRAVPDPVTHLEVSPVSRLTTLTLRGFGARPAVVLPHVAEQAMACSFGDQPLKGASVKRELLGFLLPLDA